MPKSSDYFILSIATHDNRTVATSLANMMGLSILLKRYFILNVQSGTGHANVRQKCVDVLKKQFPDEDHVYTFWLDSDIIVNENPQNIANYITEAESRGVSFTGNYRALDPNTNQTWNTAAKKYPLHYTDEELKNAKPFDLKCDYAGLGLCYIKMPLNYTFRTTGHEQEDLLFFQDNPEIDMRYVPISNFHMKTCYI